MDTGDTAWILASSALVLFMIPGLALFYGGMVRGKNLLSMLMKNFVAMGVVTVTWIVVGYSLAFSGDVAIGDWGIIGNLDLFALGELGIGTKLGLGNAVHGLSIPDNAFMVFQMMFAIITPALITGAFAERFKFKTYLIFLVLWVTFVYAPIAHWVWGNGGWLLDLGTLDFAGGTVVHINAGVAAIAAAYLVGKRRNVDRGVEPHNVPFVIIGAAILWFGWFGFNAGSGLASDGIAINAFLVTNTAAAAAMVVWLILGNIHTGKMSAVGAATGVVAGLVAITPASGYVGPMGSIAIGLGAGVLTFYAVRFRYKFGFDDALEVMAVHGIGGIWGALATGIFAVGGIGLIDGNARVLGYNAIAVVSTIGYSFIVTFVILKVLDVIPGLGLRAEDVEEDGGLDIALHGERAYVGDGAD